MLNVVKTARDWNKYRKINRIKSGIWTLNKDKAICVELRKVASRSLKSTLAEYLIKEEKGSQYLPTNIELQLANERFTSQISPKELAKLAKTHYVFTIVRNPLSRLYSCYTDKIVNYKKFNKKNILAFYGFDLNMSFSDFVDHIVNTPDSESNTHFRSMYKTITHKGILIPHQICKLEQLSTDWTQVQSKLVNLPDLKVKNVSKAKPKPTETIISEYTKDLAEKVYQRFYKDVSLLGYEHQVKSFISSLPS